MIGCCKMDLPQNAEFFYRGKNDQIQMPVANDSTVYMSCSVLLWMRFLG